MTELDDDKVSDYENLIDFLEKNGVEIEFFMQPFSVTQSESIYDEGTNPVFSDVEEYLREIGKQHSIRIIGGYDARDFDISDEDFIDFMHIDSAGTRIVWNTANRPVK